jgi:replicative DNA helicase
VETLLGVSPNGHHEARVPPYNLEAEEAVVGSLLIGGIDAYIRVSDTGIGASDFYRETYAQIYEAAERLFRQGSRIDRILLLEELEKMGVAERIDGSSKLYELEGNTPSAYNCAEYAYVVKETAASRRVIDAGRVIMDIGYDRSLSGGEAVGQAQKRVIDLTDARADFGSLDSNSLMDEFIQVFNARKSGEVAGLRTGLEALDRRLCGLRGGDVAIFAGCPAMGKTSLALQMVLNVAKSGVPAAFFSLEMISEQISEKLIASEADVELARVISGKVDKEENSRIMDAVDRISQLPLYIETPKTTDDQSIRNQIQRLYHSKKVGLVALDYIQLVKRSGRSEGSRASDLATVSRNFKCLATDLKIPIILLSQLSRDLTKREDKRPEMYDLRDSGALEQDAAVVVMLYRDDQYTKEKSERPGICELIVRKNRFGPLATVDYRFDGSRSRFVETMW